jgi:hypothetical protein
MITIFGEKVGVFLKNQYFHNLAFVLSEKRHFFRLFWRKFFKIHNIGPRLVEFSPFCRFSTLGKFPK